MCDIMFRFTKAVVHKNGDKMVATAVFALMVLSGLLCVFLSQENPHQDGFIEELSEQEPVNNENSPLKMTDDSTNLKGSSPYSKETRSSPDDFDLQHVLGYGSTIGFLNSIKSADLDNDGKEEIVFGNEEGNIFVTERDGNHLINEWISPFLGGGRTYGLALGDVDSDSTIEIVVGSADGFVRTFGWNGTAYEIEWQSPDLGNFAWGLDVGNVDDDEYLEIVIGTGEIEYVFNSNGEYSYRIDPSPIDENLFIFGFDGTGIEQEWSTIIPALDQYTGIYNVAIGNTDDDSRNEIVIGTFDIKIDNGERLGRFGIFGFNGITYSPEWALQELALVMGIDIGNTDNDDRIEIVIATYGSSDEVFALYVYGYSGSVYGQEWKNSDANPTGVVVGDTDDDGIAEIIVSSGRWARMYEYLGSSYVQTWASGDLGIFVSGVGVGQSDSTSQNEIFVADFYTILIYGLEGLNYELKVLEEGFGKIVSVASSDMNENGIKELYLLSRSGTIFILEFDGNDLQIKDTFEARKGDINPNIKYTNIVIADFDGDEGMEMLVVEGNTSVDYVVGGLSRSMLSYSTLFFVEFADGDYSVIDQVDIADNSIFSIGIGDLDNDMLLEVAAGGTIGDLFIVGYSGSSYQIEYQMHVSDDPIDCVGTGDTDGDGTLEIALGDDSGMVHIIGHDDVNYVEEWNATLDQIWFPLALEVGSMDEDDYEEIFIKGAESGDPLSIYKWNEGDYEEAERFTDYDITFEECLSIGEIFSSNSPQLLLGSFSTSIIEYDSGYSEIWVSDISGVNAVSTEIADIDSYLGNELIVALDGMIVIYGSKTPPTAALSVKNSAFVGEGIIFDGSNSSGDAPLRYFFDFGDSENSGWITDPIIAHSYSASGTYTASLKVMDRNNVESSPAQEIITISDINKAPIAYIDEITPNPANFGEKVCFSGHGFDEDGTITSYSWTSDINGELSDSASFSSSSLSVGTHTVFFKVKDNNETWSENVTATLVIKTEPQNQVPIAYIDSISPNPTIEGETITFSGHGVDNDGTVISYSWESDIDGVINDQDSFSNSSLSVGTHTISFKVEDDDETWSQADTATLTIDPKPQNQAPIAYIGSISPNPAEEGDTIYFTGYGVDNDGTIISYSWESDIDGVLSDQDSFNTSSLSVGEHTITFKVKDDKNLWSESVTITLKVNEKENGEEPPSGETDDEDNDVLFTVLLGIIGLVIVIIIAALIAQTQKKKSGTAAMQTRCPGCSFVFSVTSPSRPLNVQCPNCGLSGVLNE